MFIALIKLVFLKLISFIYFIPHEFPTFNLRYPKTIITNKIKSIKNHFQIHKRHLYLITIITLINQLYVNVKSIENLNIPNTDPIEISALLEIKKIYISSTNGHTFLSEWNETTDPCQNLWPNVICTCDQLESTYFMNEIDYCNGYQPSIDMSHVIALEFKDDLFKFNGRLSDEIGKFKMLRKLDMSSNDFIGSIPDSFASLIDLRDLKLSQNQLSGNLPTFFGDFKELQLLNLAYNDFSGPIPDEWCNNWSSNGFIPDIDLRYNQNLCGEYSQCLLPNEIPSYLNDGTHLFTGVGNDQNAAYCDVTAPICDDSIGFKFEVPEYWNSIDLIKFNFTDCLDIPFGIAEYKFSIREYLTDNDLDDSIRLIEASININNNPINITTNHILENGKAQLLHVVILDLIGSPIVIKNNFKYVIALSAINFAGPPLTTTVLSKPIRVDTTGPLGGQIFNTPHFIISANQVINGLLGVSWEPFSDPESDIFKINVIVQELLTTIDSNLKITQDFKDLEIFSVSSSDMNSLHLENEIFEVNKAYRYSIAIFNYAGLVTYCNSPVFELN